MNRFWNNLMLPIFKEINAKTIVEVGSDTGINTKNILEYCKEHDANLIAIDPLPKFNVEEFKSEYGDRFEIFMELSLSRIPLLNDYDVILLDGDHNWYTLYNELKLIEKSFKNKKFPLIFFHDIGWPYARRDLYYDPDNIPAAFRQPYKKLGMYPDEPNLLEKGGLNTHLNNAIYENNLKNGVLTAIEDFIKESDLEFSFHMVNAYHGLGILYPKNDQMNSIIIKQIQNVDFISILEKERVKLFIERSEMNIRNSELNSQVINYQQQLEQKYKQLQNTEYLLKKSDSQLQKSKREIKKLKKNEKNVKKLTKELEDLNARFYEMQYLKGTNRPFIQRLISIFPSLYILLNSKNHGIKKSMINIKGYSAIQKNQLFDRGYYLKNNKDVRKSGMDPLLHYIYHGYKEERNPSPEFNGKYYLKTHKKVKKAKLNPLIHYALYGKKEGRKISAKKPETEKTAENEIRFKSNPKISIKVPAPNKKEAKSWGDYHFAKALKREFEKKFYQTEIDFKSTWGKKDDADVVLVLRGLHEYPINPDKYNIMWNISHPDMVSEKEYNQYDYVFVASDLWSRELKNKLNVPVESLLQCTDPQLFYPEHSKKYEKELLFVGNSRNVFRKIIKDILPTERDLAVYGKFWEQFIPKKYIKGDYIPNSKLHKVYSSCKILLNDHWPDMAEKGFISNRLFDGFASGTFIISDEIEGANEIFEDALVTYSESEELHELIEHYLKNEEEREQKAKKGRNIVLMNHTFQNRAETILKIIKNNEKKSNNKK